MRNPRWSRRGLLGAGAALPFLDFARSGCAPPARAAGPATTPKRFLLVHHPQGVVMDQWAPIGTESNFTLPTVLAPLARHQARLTVVAGVDNKIGAFNSTGNGHENADMSLLTCMPFQDQSAAVLVGGGPSIDQVVAERISTTTPFSRLDFGIGGGTVGGGVQSGSVFWVGAADPVVFTNDPSRMLATIFGDPDLSAEDLVRQQARRASVIEGALAQFDLLRPRLDSTDRARLDAHQQKLVELEARVTGSGATACAPPVLSLPAGYDFGFDDDTTSPAMLDLLTAALACDQTRVATMSFLTGHDPTFPWLSTSSGAPVVPVDLYDNWHGMVHDGRTEEGLLVGFSWYAEIFAQLLDRLAVTVDTDGENLLDTTLVAWVSEFGNGAGHNTLKIPVVLAGATGALSGRFLDYMNGGPMADYESSDFHMGQVWVSVLEKFGQSDTTFGLTDASLAPGPLPGL